MSERTLHDMDDIILETRDLTKHYGGVHALEGADFALRKGEHVAIMGDNGAGKSTFVRQITGVEKPTRGEIVFDGQARQFDGPLDAREAGIETVFQTLALAEYRGLTVAHMDALRKQAREQGVYLHVLKNTLARRAVAGTPFEVVSEAMVGPLIYGFSEDAVAAAKVIADFAKTNDKLVVKAGAYAGKALDVEGVKALASIPSREVLIAQVAGLLKSPIQRMAGVLAAVAEQRGGGEAQAEAPAAA